MTSRKRKSAFNPQTELMDERGNPWFSEHPEASAKERAEDAAQVYAREAVSGSAVLLRGPEPEEKRGDGAAKAEALSSLPLFAELSGRQPSSQTEADPESQSHAFRAGTEGAAAAEAAPCLAKERASETHQESEEVLSEDLFALFDASLQGELREEQPASSSGAGKDETEDAAFAAETSYPLTSEREAQAEEGGQDEESSGERPVTFTQGSGSAGGETAESETGKPEGSDVSSRASVSAKSRKGRRRRASEEPRVKKEGSESALAEPASPPLKQEAESSAVKPGSPVLTPEEAGNLEDVPFPNVEQAPYRMIDLFAGIGGTRLAFSQTGRVNVVFSSEINKQAAKTYALNFGEIPEGDLTAIASEDIPAHDILVGGFPCQAFSRAGKKRGFEDTRGTLFFELARVLKDKRPKAFLLENVKNLITHDKGHTFEVIRKTLEDLGYAFYYRVLKASDFGVPQHRERVYMVGFDKAQVPCFADFRYPSPTGEATRLGDILDKEVDERYTLSDRLWEGHQRRKAQNQKAGKGFGYGLFDRDSPSANTLSARYYKDGSEILIAQEGKNPRKLTPREAARLQGFPETFRIVVSDARAYEQFGNSVAVPVVHAVALEILKVLDAASLGRTL